MILLRVLWNWLRGLLPRKQEEAPEVKFIGETGLPPRPRHHH